MRRIRVLALLAGALAPSAALAQAPPVGPLVLALPATPRTAALGNAWVAGRDQDVLFYNPAQLIGARQGLDLSITRHGRNGTAATMGSIYAGGKWSLTLGWGVQFVNFSASPAEAYPYSPDVLLTRGPAEASSALAAIGGAFTFKGFRIGASGKFVSERVSMPPGFLGEQPVSHSAMLADLGVARNLFGGVAAASVQNLGPEALDDAGLVPIPRQGLFGWSMTKPAGPLDIGVVGQVTVRDGWTAPGAGIEASYSWIEGYVVVLRAGARRPEAGAEHPFTFGAALTADRLTVEYGVQFFEGGRTANGVTIRWR